MSNPALPHVAPVRVRYGLPCAHCSIYYEADLATCPICGCGDRVSPVGELARTSPML